MWSVNQESPIREVDQRETKRDYFSCNLDADPVLSFDIPIFAHCLWNADNADADTTDDVDPIDSAALELCGVSVRE